MTADKTLIKHAITNAIISYALSELTALSYHDPTHTKESAYDAMQKLKEEANKIAGYALVGLSASTPQKPK